MKCLNSLKVRIDRASITGNVVLANFLTEIHDLVKTDFDELNGELQSSKEQINAFKDWVELPKVEGFRVKAGDFVTFKNTYWLIKEIMIIDKKCFLTLKRPHRTTFADPDECSLIKFPYDKYTNFICQEGYPRCGHDDCHGGDECVQSPSVLALAGIK